MCKDNIGQVKKKIKKKEAWQMAARRTPKTLRRRDGDEGLPGVGRPSRPWEPMIRSRGSLLGEIHAVQSTKGGRWTAEQSFHHEAARLPTGQEGRFCLKTKDEGNEGVRPSKRTTKERSRHTLHQETGGEEGAEVGVPKGGPKETGAPGLKEMQGEEEEPTPHTTREREARRTWNVTASGEALGERPERTNYPAEQPEASWKALRPEATVVVRAAVRPTEDSVKTDMPPADEQQETHQRIAAND